MVDADNQVYGSDLARRPIRDKFKNAVDFIDGCRITGTGGVGLDTWRAQADNFQAAEGQMLQAGIVNVDGCGQKSAFLW